MVRLAWYSRLPEVAWERRRDSASFGHGTAIELPRQLSHLGLPFGCVHDAACPLGGVCGQLLEFAEGQVSWRHGGPPRGGPCRLVVWCPPRRFLSGARPRRRKRG